MTTESTQANPTPDTLDAKVDALCAQLRNYVAVARGVRAEFSAEETDVDPRVEEAGLLVNSAMTDVEVAFDGELGFFPSLAPLWVTEEDIAAEAAEDDLDPDEAHESADLFSIALIVSEPATTAADSKLGSVLEVLDSTAETLVETLEAQGLTVTEYAVARGIDPEAALLSDFGLDEDEDDEDEDEDEQA